MAKVILYEGDSGIVVVSPAAQLDIDEFAKNFVPPKTKYNIIIRSQTFKLGVIKWILKHLFK